MATTPKGIYYPNNYNEIADIPEDMKKMAESIEKVFEDTDSDLSDIKEEQTTQNNRLNSLEVDNTTNKSDILTNKQEINNIKTEQTEQNTNISTNATNIESLQEENENLKKIVSQLPQVEGTGTSITLENTIEATFTKFDVEGNSEQETTEGYNMLDLEKYSYSESSSALNGGTVTIKDGIITLNATNATGNMTALSVTKIATADSIEAGTYYFGVDVYGAYESTPSTNIWQYRGNRTLTEKFIMKQWKFGVTQGNIASTPILVSNDTSKTTYEKYTNGASPSPNWEQPIYSAGDNENIIDINRTLGTPSNTGYDNTNKRTFDVTKLIKFLTANNYYNAGVQIDYSLIDNGIKITTKQAGYGIGFPVILSSAKTYTISANIDVIDNQMIRAIFYKEDGTYISNVTSSGTNKFLTFTTTDDTYFVVIMLTPKANVETTYSKIKLEKGNKASGYSPYGMGSINEKINNKNWFNKNSNFKTYNASVTPIDTGIKVENNDGGTYRSVWCEIGKDELLGKTLAIQTSISTYNGAISRILVVFNNETAQYIEQIKTITTSTEGTLVIIPNSFPENADRVSLIFYCSFTSATPKGSYVEYKDLQVELGSTATSYVPHEEQDYPIFVQQPFRSNKDKTIKDKFVIKSDNKKYERHYIGEVVLNGTENIARELISNNVYKFYINNIENVDYGDVNYVPQILCNKLIAVARTPMYLNTQGISSGNGNLQIYTDETKNMTVSEFKTWLENNNLIVNYLKTIPLDLPCTPEQIQQLENKPSTYKDFTIIQSQDETPAYLEVSGIRDIDTMFDKVTNAIVSLGGNV